ncbi:MAG TPA: helix-turn-helix transcriptional regulator [Solirubrobacteraceae bacterium]|nr:helix-turn-helix transcriptional regulator [Solirubrobacteraceae bacterium]
MPAKKSAQIQALGRAISDTRHERGMPQEAFARHAGLDRSYFGAVERGEFNLTITTLLKIATGLDVPASSLLERAKL